MVKQRGGSRNTFHWFIFKNWSIRIIFLLEMPTSSDLILKAKRRLPNSVILDTCTVQDLLNYYAFKGGISVK